LNNFALSSLFSILRGRFCSALDSLSSPDLSEFTPLLGSVHHPHAFALLLSLIDIHEGAFETNYSPRRVVYALAEVLLTTNHRNHVLLASSSLVVLLLDRYFSAATITDEISTATAPQNPISSKQERQTLQKLVKRLLEIGAPIDVSRDLFRRAVREDNANKLDAEILDLLRSGMKSRWPPHFILDGAVTMEVKEEGVKGLSANGFTFMVSHVL
jgi:hypothetical protein